MDEQKIQIPITPSLAISEIQRVSDLDSETLLQQRKGIKTSLIVSGRIISDLVRFSSISPAPIWYRNRSKLHIKEIRKRSREHMVLSAVCCALWTKNELEALKLFKLSWAQRIMKFGEPSIMYFCLGENDKKNLNCAKKLFEIAE